MSFDAAEGQLVLFGGEGLCGPCNDTWVLQNGTWTNLSGVQGSAPSGRGWAALAYDPLLGGDLLFGGTLTAPAGSAAGDSWLFRNDRWTELRTLESPPARWAAGFAFDPILGGMVLFGGFSPTLGFLSDTWLFADGEWSPLAASGPPARWAPSFAFDPAQGALVLFGGLSANATVLGDTWLLENGTWSSPAEPQAPSAREKAAFAYDPALQALVLFGGDTCPPGCSPAQTVLLNDTWTFEHGQWGNATASVGPAPPARCCGALVYDPVLPALLLSAGEGATGDLSPQPWSLALPSLGPLTILGAQALPGTILEGSSTSIEVGVTGNHGAVSYLYAELPYPCAPSTAWTISCVPSETGTFSISVEVRDASGNLSTASTMLTVLPGAGNGTLEAPAGPDQSLGSAAIPLAAGLLLIAVAAVVWVRARGRSPPAAPAPSAPSSTAHSLENR